MEKDLMQLIAEVDLTDEEEVRCVCRIITTLRAAIKTGTVHEFVRVAAEFASETPMRVLEEMGFPSYPIKI